MRAGVRRIVFEHLFRSVFGQFPIACLAGCLRDRFQSEKRLAPGVRSEQCSKLALYLFEQSAAFFGLAFTQQAFCSERFKLRLDRRLSSTGGTTSDSARGVPHLFFRFSKLSLCFRHSVHREQDLPGNQMTCRARPWVLTRDQRVRSRERFLFSASSKQEPRPFFLGELEAYVNRSNLERLLHQLLGGVHLPDVLV